MKYKFLSNFQSVKIISSEIKDGSMSLNNEKNKKNQNDFFEKNNIPKPITFCQQVHKDKVAFISKSGFHKNIDGMFTDKNITLSIRSADCAPVMFFSKKENIIGVLHCGRKSVTSKIISNSLNNLLEEHKLKPSDFEVFLAPHICVKNYEIKPDILDELKNSKFEKFILEKDGHYFFNLTEAIVSELVQIGVKRENILDCGIDTYGSQNFFSARQDRNLEIKTFLTVIFKNG
ncbi:MAG: polyphenol oxidase family protein [Candidatus Berkelbacteria bacterium]|nr:polyphenol oxidase family protein [Candidatus Berkelbacteria bacterium]